MSRQSLAPLLIKRTARPPIKSWTGRPKLEAMEDRKVATTQLLGPATVPALCRQTNGNLTALLAKALKDQYPSHLLALMNREAALAGMIQHHTSELIDLLHQPQMSGIVQRETCLLTLLAEEHSELIGLLRMHDVELTGLLGTQLNNVLSANDRHELTRYLQKQNDDLDALLRNDSELIGLLRHEHIAIANLLNAQHAEISSQVSRNHELINQLSLSTMAPPVSCPEY